MSAPARKPATYEDLRKVPENLVAEIIAGELHTHPRPVPRHVAAASALDAEIQFRFQRGRGGPGEVCAPPFDAISFPLANLIPFDAPKGGEIQEG